MRLIREGTVKISTIGFLLWIEVHFSQLKHIENAYAEEKMDREWYEIFVRAFDYGNVRGKSKSPLPQFLKHNIVARKEATHAIGELY